MSDWARKCWHATWNLANARSHRSFRKVESKTRKTIKKRTAWLRWSWLNSIRSKADYYTDITCTKGNIKHKDTWRHTWFKWWWICEPIIKQRIGACSDGQCINAEGARRAIWTSKLELIVLGYGVYGSWLKSIVEELHRTFLVTHAPHRVQHTMCTCIPPRK